MEVVQEERPNKRKRNIEESCNPGPPPKTYVEETWRRFRQRTSYKDEAPDFHKEDNPWKNFQ